EYYGRAALRMGAGVPVLSRPGETNVYRYQPRGVGVVIAPWNFPLAIPAGMATAPLVTGNCVVLKPAEQTPGVAFRLVEILLEAGLPPGARAFLPGVGEEVGPALVDHPATAFVAFTGSRAVGLSLVERAAVHHPGQRLVKRVIAEMGGKNAIVVDADADLDQAVPAIVASAFAYAGQKCSAAARVIAVGPVLEELLERLVGATAIVPVGHARELRTVVGPLIDEDAYRRVREYQAVARSPVHIRRAADELRAGNLYVNRAITGARVGRQPFGGYGLSGVGSKAGGPDYLLQFVEPRTVTENTIRQGFAPVD